MTNLQDLKISPDSADSLCTIICGIGKKLRKLRNISRQKAGLLFNRVESNF